MALDFVVNDAKKTKLRRVQEACFGGKYVSPHKGKIIGDDYPTPSAAAAAASSKAEASSAVQGTDGEETQQAEEVEYTWEKCRHRAVHGPKSLCRKYTSGCAQNKCPKKNMDF